VAGVLAQSFARIFYRNAINIGLPAIVCDTTRIEEGDELELHLSDGVVENLTRKTTIRFPAMSKTMDAILSEGGLISYVEKYGDLVFS
jgi:3-isopropylmalate/(R)-2-methylmalate dehydratase small subunit